MAYSIDPGKFRTRVTIDVATQQKGQAGGFVAVWTPVAGMWCQVRHHSGTERAATKAAGGKVAIQSTEFVSWWRPDITTQHRINLGGVHYDIKHINNVDEESQFMIVTAESGLNNG